ncbi:hypothetical protein BJX76DRAFT_333687 [Aspergillus varians]
MLSPSTYSLSRQPPPVRLSPSLEGLEKVVPPSPPVPVAHTRSQLLLDKPLPDLPAKSRPPSPVFIGSTAWSDDSSTVNSFYDLDEEDRRRHSSVSTGSYPVFVRSGSDGPDLADYVDHPSVSTLGHTPSVHDPYETQQKPVLTTFLADDRYTPTPPPHWNNRVGPNHYFREKKWDFFPELAIPSALPQNSPHNNFAPRPRKKDSGRSRWIPIPTDKGASLANDVRNSIRSIQRRLSRNSLDKDKPKRTHRPTTAPTEFARGLYSSSYTPSDPHTAPSSSSYFDRRCSIPQSPLDVSSVGEKTAHLSISPTGSTISDQSLITEQQQQQSQPTASTRSKQLAVPISPYQKYGAAIWDKSGKERKRLSYRQTQRVRFPKYRNRNRRNSCQNKNATVVSSATVTSPPSVTESPGRTQTCTPLQHGTRHAVKAIQDGTSHVLIAIDGARRRMAGTRMSKTGAGAGAGSKLDRRRSYLKSQIRLVGPVNPYTSHREDPWI